jgi:pSer/pThr/pTyr-binding forkhead associated (FHA) protein
MRSWVIGGSSDCDVVVGSPLASGRHCELTQTADGYVLKDLGSTNGTFLNGVRIAGPIRVTAGDSITLGRTIPFPWPPELTTAVRIGRLPDNDIVLDDARVSGHHARLIVGPLSHVLIEDTGSSNGTFLNSADQRITGPTRITKTDTIHFGTLAVPAARLLAGLKQPEPAVTAVCEVVPPAAPVGPAVADSNEVRWLLAWLIQTIVFAVLIVLIFGRHSTTPITAASRASVGQGIARTTFALVVATMWLGTFLALGEIAIRGSRHRETGVDRAKFFASLAARIAALTLLCAVGCAVLLAIVYWGSGLKGPSPAMWGVLLMTALLSIFAVLVVATLIPNWTTAAVVMVALFVPLVALGGCFWRLPDMNGALQSAAASMPSRWAFEGLLLLETREHPVPMADEKMPTSTNDDLAEDFFPAGSERMGASADVMALGSMLIGLVALSAFLWWRPPVGR